MWLLSPNPVYDRIRTWRDSWEEINDPNQLAWRFWSLGSLPVCTVRGVDVRIHVLALSGVFLHFAPLYFLAIMMALLMHEAGHALMAQLNACDVRGIVLLPPIGAVMIGEVNPSGKPWGSFVVAAAGPFVNLIGCYSIMPVCKGLGLVQSYSTFRFVSDLAEISGIIGFVNLLPLWPLDGGRMVQSLLMVLKIEDRKVEVGTFGISLIAFLVAFGWSWFNRNYRDMAFLCVFITASYWMLMKND